MVNGRDLRPLSHEPLPDFEAQFGYPWYIFHRVDLHSELKRMVSEPRPNTSAVAKIHLLSEVADIDLDGNMTLVTGETLKKDLIVVADGIRVRCLCYLLLDGQERDHYLNFLPMQTQTPEETVFYITDTLPDPERTRFHGGRQRRVGSNRANRSGCLPIPDPHRNPSRGRADTRSLQRR